MKLTFYGQNTWLIETAGKQLLIDPAISMNPLAKDIIDIDAIQCDYILLTHGHGDHVADVEKIAERTEATIVANYEVASYYGGKNFKYHPMNHGGRWDFEFGQLAMVNAVHSSVLPDGTYGGNPAGFILMNEEATIYIAGDTAVTMDMQLIPRLYPKLDVALLPIGDNFTMGINDAVVAAEFIDCKKIIGCHYDTFPYIEIDHNTAVSTFKDAGMDLTLLEISESIDI
ncbi:MAG: L-ascorbate metabolism protein UlaG (beta-lactamase superfamily) [Saprospiraceae bacterium]|jgi:L-ascorbate metabolism protein UlaG (beta-lactamase superfamily)